MSVLTTLLDEADIKHCNCIRRTHWQQRNKLHLSSVLRTK